MAKINGGTENQTLIDIIKSKINELNNQATMLDDDSIEKTNIQGRIFLKTEEEKVNNLTEIIEILNFDGKEIEENELLCYGNTNDNNNDITKIYIEPSKQQKLFELVNNSEVKAASIVFPKVFGEYGEIPNTNGLIRPRPRGLFENIDSYEKYLEDFYKDTEFRKAIGENGLRKPYPHEYFVWSKGTASAPLDSSYRLESYQEYVSEAEQKRANNVTSEDAEKRVAAPLQRAQAQTSENNTTPIETPEANQTATERQEESNRRKTLRQKPQKNGRSIVTKITSFFEKQKENIRNDQEKFKTGTKEEKWKLFKKYLTRAVLITAGGILAIHVAGPLLGVLAKGAIYLPTMLQGAITGMIPGTSGMISLTALDRIVYAIVSLALPTSLIYSIIKLAKKQKEKETEKVKEPAPRTPNNEPTPSTPSTPASTPTPETTPQANPTNEFVVEGATIEERIAFIQNKLTTLGNDLRKTRGEIEQLSTNEHANGEIVQREIQNLKTKEALLKLQLKQCIAAYNKIFDDEKIELVSNSMGGAKI